MKKNTVISLAVSFLIFLHLYLLSHLSFTVWPEMLLMPYLMHRGFELYRDMIVPWTPGLVWMLSGWFGIVGLSVDRLKLLTWVLIAGIDVLIFFIARRRYGVRAAIVALFSFVVLQPLFDGNGLWFDLAVVPLLLVAFGSQNPLFLGPAFLIKQSVIWTMPLFFRQWKKLLVGIFISIGVSIIWFWHRQTLPSYLFWAYDYTFRIFPTMPGHHDFATWRQWGFALSPMVLILLFRFMTARSIKWIIDPHDPATWMILALPFAIPRFGFFHFQPSIAFLALTIGKCVTLQSGKITRFKKLLATQQRLIVLCFFVYCLIFWLRVSTFDWQKPDRFLGTNQFQFAARVALETKKDEPVLIVNGPELVYVLTDRIPPKPWFTQFPWFLELPGFQEHVVEKFKDQDLHQVIFTPYLHEGEFKPGSYQPKKLLDYLNRIEE